MLQPTLPLGRVAGVRLGAHWSALVTVGVFTWILAYVLAADSGYSVAVWVGAATGAVGLLASLVLHELAHAVTARRGGLPVEQVVLWLLGGVAAFGREPDDPRADLRIALAGPFTSFVLAAGLFAAGGIAAAHSGAVPAGVLFWLATMNSVVAAFNLLPAAPLDGGRVLRALVWWHTGDRLRATAAAARSGRVLGTFLMIAGAAELVLIRSAAGLWLLLLGWFLASAAAVELADAARRHQLGRMRIRDVMTTHPTTVPGTWTVADLVGSDILRGTRHGVFPVVDEKYHPVGLLTWAALVAVPVAERETTTVGRAARPVPEAARAHPDELLAEVCSRVLLRPDTDLITVLDDHNRIVAVVTSTDVTRACQRSALGITARAGS
ncbi:site-2 protease family protein [Nocardia sp. NPDC003963]